MLFNFSVSLFIGLEMGHLKTVRDFFSRSTHFAVWFKIPCIYALLPDKSADTYRKIFEEVRNTLDLEHSPQDIVIDFEIAAINAAAAATFEGKKMKVCFFNLRSNMRK